MDKMNYVYTISSDCVGCNKCILKCPTNANKAVLDNQKNKVLIKEGFCISCGECISICDHGARDYEDDLDLFFNDLKEGVPISAIVAPAAKTNFDNLNQILGYLKSIGVKNVYDVSLGADICTWAHLKFIKEHNPRTLISQPCPVIVSYVEKYQPELIDYLSPIQSPIVCLATYLKKQLNIQDKILFLSPCIGKKRELSTEVSDGRIDYNVTFSKFLEYINDNSINFNDYPSSSFDNIGGSIGATFSMPGGLCQNIKYHLGENTWIKSIEGIFNIEEYFKQYIEDIKNNNPVPLIVDVLNCKHGCNSGTGTYKNTKFNAVDVLVNDLIKNSSVVKAKELMDYFDNNFNYEDFIRTYTNKSDEYTPDEIDDLELTYIELGKLDEADRHINCFSCGYASCESFAKAMAAGNNHKDNCKYYLLNKFLNLSYVDDLTGVKNRNSYATKVSELSVNHPGVIGIIFVDINGLKEANDRYGHTFGDNLIKECADILKNIYKHQVYRVGGDEFIVLDAATDEKLVDENIIKLKSQVENSRTLAISIGSAISFSNNDFSASVDKADKEMYKNKAEYYKKNDRSDRRNFVD